MGWMAVFVLVLLAVTTILHMPRNEAFLVIGCGLCGTLPSFIVALPGTFTVEGNAQAAHRIIRQRLEKLKFTLVEKDNRVTEFFYHGPKFLRWDTTHVAVQLTGNKTTVTGSYEVLRSLRRALIK